MTDITDLTTIAREQQHTSGAYYKRPLTLVRGQGVTVWDDAGRAYLDATSGQGVVLLGHVHPHVTQAIQHQAETLVTCTEIFYNDQRANLYTTLARILPAEMGRVFLCNSGAEAIEGALKVARLLTGRSGLVGVKRGFHGRTLGALGLTWNKDYREPFVGWTPPNITHVTSQDYDAIDEAITDQTAAVMLEPVQGEGGVYPIDPAWLQHVRRLCTERGALLIMDEVQTGLGRTGRWFGFQHSDIMPDIIALGKGLAGGVPMGAVVWRSALGTIPAGTHGTTFGGNPLASAAAVATLETLEREHLPENAATIGTWLMEQLRAVQETLPLVREVRGLGLIIGVELRQRVTPVLQALQEQHSILALPAGQTVLRLLPPLILNETEAETLLQGVIATLKS